MARYASCRYANITEKKRKTKNYYMYDIDDCSVHLMLEVKRALLKRCCVPVAIGGESDRGDPNK